MAIAIRSAAAQDAPAIAQLRIDTWRTTYRGLVPDEYLDSMQVDASADLWRRVLSAGPNTASVFVAENDGEVVGFAAGNRLSEPKHDFNAELTAIYVRREHQRAGVGRGLVRAIALAQRMHGANGLITWVIAGNKGARAFCESLGASLLVEQPFEWDGMPLVEAGYGFRDIDALVAACDVPARRGDPTVH